MAPWAAGHIRHDWDLARGRPGMSMLVQLHPYAKLKRRKGTSKQWRNEKHNPTLKADVRKTLIGKHDQIQKSYRKLSEHAFATKCK